MADPIASLGFFSGLNNVDDPMRLPPVPVKIGMGGYKAAYPLVMAVNVDIDNTYGLSSRDGSDKKVSGTDIHSGWGNDFASLFVDGTFLYLLNKDFSITELLSGLTKGARMTYAPVNDRVYMSNGTYIGYYKDLSIHSLANPAMTYKQPLPAGKFIAYYEGHILVAVGKVLYIADALCDHYDVRTGFLVFENDITMVRPVDKGIYVSDGQTYFITVKREFADDPDDFRREHVLDADAIPYSDTIINGKDVGEGLDGNIAIWTSSAGICLGDNKGIAKVVTLGRYSMPSRGIGAAVIRNKEGQVHYLASLK